MSFKLTPNNPELPNGMYLKDIKGQSPRASEEQDSQKPSGMKGNTVRRTCNVKAMLNMQQVAPNDNSAQGGVLDVDPKVAPDPYCVVPEKTQDDLSSTLAERTGAEIKPAEQLELNPNLVNGADGNNNANNNIFNGTVNELLAIFNEMANELEKEGYSFENIMNSSLIANVMGSITEGATKDQVKQAILEQLEKAPFHEVAEIRDIINVFLANAGIDNLEDFGLSTTALINEVVFRTADNNKVYTMNDVKKILDEVLCEKSEDYKYRDNAKWDNTYSDMSDFISYMTKDMGLTKSALNYVYAKFVQSIINGALGDYNISLVTEMIDDLLADGTGSVDLITSVAHALLHKDTIEGDYTTADAKAILNEIIANMPEHYNKIDDPTEMHINDGTNPNPDPDPDPDPNPDIVNKDERIKSSEKGLEERKI